MSQDCYVELRGIKQRVRVGCKQVERDYASMVRFDVRLHFNMADCIASDDVADAVDYKEVIEIISTTTQEGQWRLLERLAFDLASAMLRLPSTPSHVEVTASRDNVPLAASVVVHVRIDAQGKLL